MQSLSNFVTFNFTENSTTLYTTTCVFCFNFFIIGIRLAYYECHWPVGAFGATCAERLTCPYLFASCSWRLAEAPHFFGLPDTAVSFFISVLYRKQIQLSHL